MEFLDAYDESKNYIGKFSREEVHEKGMWHNTVHCWLYDQEGNIFFQVRSGSNKLYTTASGHVQAGETIKEAFGRETKEEIGIEVDYEKAELLEIHIWKMDKEKNGKLIKDRAFANVYLLNVLNHHYEFHFTDGEVNGIVKMKAKEVLDLFHDQISSIKGIFIDNQNIEKEMDIKKEDFLLQKGETLIEKYGKILEAIEEK